MNASRTWSATIFISGGQFYIADLDVVGLGLDHTIYTGGNGLIATRPGYAVIFSGAEMGYARVSLRTHSTAPVLQLNGWEDVVEDSVPFTGSRIIVSGPGGDAPELADAIRGPGTFRLRIHTCRRDVAASHQAVAGRRNEPVEDFLIDVWPEPTSPAVAHKLTDMYGAKLRN